MSKFNFEKHPHRRYNPLTGEWLQVSPHRAKRPWQGQEEKSSETKRANYDSSCYLCPGNVRANGEKNPAYSGTFSFFWRKAKEGSVKLFAFRHAWKSSAGYYSGSGSSANEEAAERAL